MFKRNYEWLSKLKLEDLIKLMSYTTVQQMIERDMFDRRLKQNDPIGLQEFIYPLMQGYDSVAMGVDLEIGGTDQTFNMLMGRSLVKSYLGKEKYVRTNEMMDAPDGITMSKTKGNGINLSDSAQDMYGKAMSYSDDLIVKGMRLLTDIELEEIKEYEKQMASGENPMNFKKKLAFEIVKLLKGAKSAEEAQDHFESTVQNKENLEEYARVSGVTGEMSVYDFLKKTLGDEISGAQIKRVIEQGGVEVNNEKITDSGKMVKFESGTLVKYGKREFFKVE